MKIRNSSLHLNWQDLTVYGISTDYLKVATHRNRSGASDSFKNMEIDGKNHIEYASIPDSYLEKYNIPAEQDLSEICRQEQLKSLLKLDTKAFDVFYTSPASEYATDLQEISSWLMICAPLTLTNARGLGYTSVNGFYQDVVDLTKRQKLHGAVGNLRIFKNKLKPFYQYFKSHPEHFDTTDSSYYFSAPTRHPMYEDALVSLISKKYGIRNRARLKQKDSTDKQAEEQQAYIVWLYSKPQKLNFNQTYLAYMREAAQRHALWKQSEGMEGWDDRCNITEQTLKNFLSLPEIKQVWYSKRHGRKPAAEVFTPVTKRKAASFANAKWVIDGKPMQINFSHKGNNYSKINVFVVLDEYSWAVVGYQISFSENTDQVLLALRDACKRTQCLPHEIQSDNGSAIDNFHVQHAIGKIAKHFIPASVGNARSKRIESFFQHFNTQVLKFEPGFYGKHHNTLDRKANEEHMLKLAKGNQLPTLAEAFTIMDRSFNTWNSIVFNGDLPLKKFMTNLEKTRADQRQFTPEIDVEAFWHQPGKMIQIKDLSTSKQKTRAMFKPTEYQFSNKGIIVQRQDPLTKKKEHHVFDIPDAAFNAANIGQKFTLRIEPENFEHARIYLDGRPVLDAAGAPILANSKVEMPSAQVDHTTETRQALANELGRKKEQEKIIESRFDRYLEIVEKNGQVEQINANWMHGKEVANNAEAQLNEQRLNAHLTKAKELPEEVEEEDEELVAIDREVIRRF